jgi:DNA-binding NtrC family response regulator
MSDAHTEALPGAGSASVRVRAATLEIRSGPDAGQRVRVEAPRFTIGTAESCDLCLHDGTVSREHLTLALGPEGLVLRDHSRNGTSLGGAAKIREVVLTGDAVLTLGTTTIAVSLDSGFSDIPIASRDRFGDAYGASMAMRHVFGILERAKDTNVTVLLEGESGVGKEVLARAIHDESPRHEAPFVAVDCGAIPAGVIESELFGHVRGAFTGATHDRVGLFDQASGGTLFLDEIGELPLELQPKLLRALELRQVRPVGGREERKIDVRVVAATNRNLAAAVTDGTFRKDLFYRLAVARVVVPPLRDRIPDVIPLATMFLRRALGDQSVGLAPDIAAMLAAHRWPGNVRELKNVVERHALLGIVDRKNLFDGESPRGPDAPADLWEMRFHEARKTILDDFERTYLTRALDAAGGVVAQAVDRTGIPRPTFYRMLDRLGLTRESVVSSVRPQKKG